MEERPFERALSRQIKRTRQNERIITYSLVFVFLEMFTVFARSNACSRLNYFKNHTRGLLHTNFAARKVLLNGVRAV